MGEGFELVWAIESVWVGCFGGAGMCMVVEASLNRGDRKSTRLNSSHSS